MIISLERQKFYLFPVMCEEDFGHVLSCWIFLISAWLWELDSTPYPVPYLRFGTKWFTKAICFVKPEEDTKVIYMYIILIFLQHF